MASTTRKIVAMLVAILLAGTLVWAGVAFWNDGSDADPLAEFDATTTPLPVTGDLSVFYDQEVEWSECGSQFDCGWLQVPLDYDAPDGERIDLALLRRGAGEAGSKVGSLVVNPGGPGAPGTQMVAQIAFMFGDPLLDAFDVVGFDPRGTGRSAPLDCLSDAEMDEFVASNPNPQTDAEIAQAQEMTQAFADGCRERSGAKVDHVSSVEVARDMDVLRSVLGEEHLNFFGASYGTKLGAHYAELFPERVGRFVLDGGMDVEASNVEMSLTQARGFETALRAWAADCVAAGDCPIGDDVEGGLERLQQFLAELESEPLTVGKRSMTSGIAFYGIVMPLYLEDYWPMLTRALRDAFAGDGAGLLELSDLYTGRTPDGYKDNSLEAIGVINCLDDPSSVGYDEIPQYFEQFDEASPTFGRTFVWGLASCQSFGFDEPEPVTVDGEGAAPIVVTGTTRDPATPMEWAEALAEQLESGVLIRRDGDGHTAYNAGNACVDTAIEAYLVEGTVPEDGLNC